MADGRHIENRFWLYLGAIMTDQREIWNRDEGSHADIGHVTKTAISANSRWRTAAILKIALYPYLSLNYPISIKFGMPMQISIPSIMAIWQKNRFFFKFKIADERHNIECRFLSISRRIIGRSDRREIRKGDEESHANTGHVTKTAIFQNSRWRTSAILKTVFGVYVILVMN